MSDSEIRIDVRFAGTLGTFALDVAFHCPMRGITALFGPSGCGKTTLLRCIAGLQRMTGWLQVGTDAWQDEHGLFLPPHQRPVGYVFQEANLFPHLSVQKNLEYGITRIPDKQRKVHFREAVELLGIANLLTRRPDRLSGGQRQRVGIARALAGEPKFLILDEPVSSLDVSVRAQILNLLIDLQEKLGLTYLYISHDLSSVRFISSRVAVMYLGKIVEISDVDELYARPVHHYTYALLNAIPVPDPDADRGHSVLKGEVPSAMNPPPGCRFHPRCDAALGKCQKEVPELVPMGENHLVACHNPRRVDE